jgi:YesN/AraC family two-component response regulator
MKRILIVDDNMMMRRLIVNLFSNHDYIFDEAKDGKEGLDKITENFYDLVITDIVMPGMEGIEMIMQAKRSVPGIKIIAISGGEPFYLTLAKKLGIQGIYTKPLERKGFLKAVASYL